MLVSARQLAKKMTNQLVSQITRASFNSAVGISHNMDNSNMLSSLNHLHGGPCDTSYEDAIQALHNLQSNVETIAKARQNHSRHIVNNVPNMIKFIIRSGLTMEDVDKLSVIHVSGTKGKGSTCAMCERVLYCHGYKTGLFTSPHMIEVRERIRINGKPISKQLFMKHFWKVYNRLQVTQTENEECNDDEEGGMPHYFSFLTILSLHVFLSEGVDVAIIEVGIGGQYDSTNFFRKPVVCGVTSLGIDHTALLGNTITEIAWNKGGIFKPGRPAIMVHNEQAAMQVLQERAHEIQSPLYVSKEMSKELIHRENITLGIAGAKQYENASLAIQLFKMWEQAHTADREMRECIPGTDRPVEELPQLEVSQLDEATLKGLSSCVWPGRAQTIHRGDVTYYLDGAHTTESMQVCAQWFTQAVKQEEESGKRFARVLLFNTTSDRDGSSFLAYLTECNFDAVIFCTNKVSTVESLNSPEHLNKAVTPKGILEKVDSNKASWDDLVVKNRQQPVVGGEDCAIKSYDQSEGLCDKTGQVNSISTGCSNDSSFLDHNRNSKESTRTETGLDYEGNYIKKRKGSQEAFVDSLCHSGSRVRRIYSSTQNNSTVSCTNGITETVNSTNAQNSSDTDSEQCSKLLPNSHADFNSGVLCPKTEVQSLKFPCILQALEWATQGRQHSVTAGDPEFCAPSIPAALSDANHLQILATGSLHLVGGVLSIIDPHMND